MRNSSTSLQTRIVNSILTPGELKHLAENRALLFDQEIMKFCMGNCVVVLDTNKNKKLCKEKQEQKIDSVAAMMDAYVAYKLNKENFE